MRALCGGVCAVGLCGALCGSLCGSLCGNGFVELSTALHALYGLCVACAGALCESIVRVLCEDFFR